MSGLIGIIGNTLYIAPLYAGDHEHTATVSDWVKQDMIEKGVPLLPNYDHVEAYLLGMTYEELLEQRIVWEEHELKRQAEDPHRDSEGLLF